MINRYTVNTLSLLTHYLYTLDNLLAIGNIEEGESYKTGEAVRNYEHSLDPSHSQYKSKQSKL